MKDILKKNAFFLLPYLLFLLTVAALLISMQKGELHLAINKHHNPFADTMFVLITYLGDGFTVLFAVFLLLFYNYRYAFLTGAANVLAAGITQGLKHLIFHDVVRPAAFLKDIKELYLVPGVENLYNYSFPSGHTTAAFALYFSLALMFENKFAKFFLFCVALLTGFSRIYLSQHFLVDVFTGSIIGTLTTLFVYHYIEKKRQERSPAWMEKALMSDRNK